MLKFPYFTDHYSEARANFRALSAHACQVAQTGDTEAFQVPSPTDRDLTVDTVFIPASESPKTLLLLTSGIHGAEAPTGSAIQSWFLTELWPLIDRRSVSLAMVHVFNPYGFKHMRRTTEGNVNLNRNFLLHEEDFKTPNEKYRRLSSAFESTAPIHHSSFPIASAALLLTRLRLREKFSTAELTQAIGQGQFEFPNGLEYGGQRQEPQVKFFCERVREWSKGAKQVLHFDLHTGLGQRKCLHLIAGDNPLSRDPLLMKRFLKPELERHIYTLTSGESPGFYKTIGDINNLMPALTELPTLAMTLEFGTLGHDARSRIDSFERLYSANRGQASGYKSAQAREMIESRFIELFNPSDVTWRRNAVQLAGQLLTNVTSRL